MKLGTGAAFGGFEDMIPYTSGQVSFRDLRDASADT